MEWSVLSLPQWQGYVRSVTERAGLRLEWSDDGTASTDGKTVRLPRPSMDMTREQAMELLSLAIHEGSHVSHTDFSEGKKLSDEGGAAFQLWNIVEDDRIEAIPAREWAGDMVAFKSTAAARVERFAKAKLGHLAKLGLAASMGAPGAAAAQSAEEKLVAAALWGCDQRASWAPEYQVPAALLAQFPDKVRQHIRTLEGSDVGAKLDASRYDPTFAGSRAFLSAARDIHKLLDFSKEEEEQAKQDGMGGGVGADGGDHEAMVHGKEHELTNEDDPEELSPSGKPPRTKGEGTYEPVDPREWVTSNAEALTDSGIVTMRGTSIAVPDEPASLRGLAGQVRRLLQIATQTLRTFGHKSGAKLKGSSLYRIPMNIPGFSERVFVRKEDQLDLDVAVFLLVDASGSMNGDKIGNAILAAAELSDVIGNVLRVPVKIGMFSTMRRQLTMAGYSTPLHVNVRGFNERQVPKSKLIERMKGAAAKMLASNMDGEAVSWAANELLVTRAKRRLLVTLSDGAPAARARGDMSAYLRAVVAATEKRGIEVFGIGIQDESVREYYPKHVVLTNPADLGKIVLELVSQRILKGAH